MVEHKPSRGGQPEARQRILEAAEALFADKGFDATSISDISSQSGAGRSLIYYYFKDKQDLHAAVLQDGEARMLQIAEEAAASSGTALEQLRRFMGAFSQLHIRRQNFLRVAMRARLDNSLARDRRHEEGFARLTDTLARLLQAGVKRGELRPVDPERMVHMVMGLTHSLVVMQTKAMPHASAEENLRLAMEVLSHGIARKS